MDSMVISAAFGIQYPQYSQYHYHFSISEAKPTTSICSENIEKDFSIPNTALMVIKNRVLEQEILWLESSCLERRMDIDFLPSLKCTRHNDRNERKGHMVTKNIDFHGPQCQMRH
jgi:hypothetical protein